MTIIKAAMATSIVLLFFDPIKINSMKYLNKGTSVNNLVDHV
jgi:hypothetical protein